MMEIDTYCSQSGHYDFVNLDEWERLKHAALRRAAEARSEYFFGLVGWIIKRLRKVPQRFAVSPQTVHEN